MTSVLFKEHRDLGIQEQIQYSRAKEWTLDTFPPLQFPVFAVAGT